MPNVEIDGTNSTVKTNVLTSQSGTAITVPTGKVLTVTDAAGLTVNGVAPLTSIAADSVDGTKIADNAVDSEHYTDGSIDEAHIAADAVNFVTHLKAGTDGELITWDASGDPAAVPVGTSGHVLTSGGTGVAPTFVAAAGGGAYELLHVVNVTSATASVILGTGMSTTYRKYKLAWQVKSPAVGPSFLLQGRKAGTVHTSGYATTTSSRDTSGNATLYNNGGGSSIQLSGGWALHGPNQDFHGEIDFADIYNDGIYRFHWSATGRRTSPATTILVVGAGAFDTGGTWDGFKFFYSSGNINATSRFFLLGQKGS
jgi:hypothetical protein